MRVSVIGDSHIAALSRAYEHLRAEGGWLDGIEISFGGASAREWKSGSFIDHGDRVEFTAERFRKLFGASSLRQGKAGKHIVGLNVFYHSAPVWRSRQWLDHVPMGMAGNRLSSNVIEQIILDDQEANLKLVAALRRMGMRLFAIEAPRPFMTHLAITRGGLKPEVVAAVDSLYRNTIRTALDGLAVPTLTLPPGCFDASGFMKPNYKSETAGDQHHANLMFGMEMLQRMIPFLLEHFARKA